MNRELRSRQTVDALAYAVVLTVVAFLVTSVVSVVLALSVDAPLRSSLIGTKRLLFLVGFVLLGYGTLKLRPRSAWKQEGAIGASTDSGGEPTGIQRAVSDALPDRWSLPPDERLPVGAKLFVASVVILATSLTMELIGIRPGM